MDIRLRLDGRTCTQRCVWMSSIASRGGLPPPLKVKPARQRGGVVLVGLLVSAAGVCAASSRESLASTGAACLPIPVTARCSGVSSSPPLPSPKAS